MKLIIEVKYLEHHNVYQESYMKTLGTISAELYVATTRQLEHRIWNEIINAMPNNIL